MNQVQRANKIADDLVGAKLDQLYNLPRERRDNEVTDLILGLATALALTATMFLKHSPDQPKNFGERVGEHVTEVMKGMRNALLAKGIIKDEADTERETVDPWA